MIIWMAVGKLDIWKFASTVYMDPCNQKALRAKPKARCIVFIEATARPQFDGLSDLIRHLNVKGKAEMRWLGYHKSILLTSGAMLIRIQSSRAPKS